VIVEKSSKMKRFHVWAICAILVTAGSVAAPAAPAAGKGDASKGKQVFDGNCAVCHNADNNEKKMGPGLKGLFKKDKLVNGKKPTEANVRARVDEGGNGMPAYKDILSDPDKDDLVAYLKTL
jgi:cytochrome c